MDKQTASVIERVTSIACITALMITDALTWKIDHVLWSLGVATISGLAGYQIGINRIVGGDDDTDKDKGNKP